MDGSPEFTRPTKSDTSSDDAAMAMEGHEEEETHHHQRHQGRQSRASGSRRTRSQVAPDWTAQESLILVNEIAAVEGDCRNTLSSFQKWKFIVGNCNALEVNRTLNQCRRQWDLLLTDYKKIKQVGSYWSLDADKRREFGVPEDFDPEVFKSMEDHLEVEDGSGTEPEDDPEAVNEEEEEEGEEQVDAIVEYDFHNQRSQVRPQKRCIKDESEEGSPNKEIMPKQERIEDKVKSPKRKREKTMRHKKRNKEEVRIAAERLQEHADMLNAILKEANGSEDADCVLADLKKQNEANQVNRARQQADMLISCLRNARGAIDELCRIYRQDPK